MASERMDLFDYDEARLISRVLNLYYLEELTQSQIAQELDLSTSKVNRLLQQARRAGMVEIRLRTPFQQLFDLESQLETVFGISEAVVIPGIPEDASSMVHTLGRAGAAFLLEQLRDGDVVAIGGGTGIYSLVEATETSRSFDVAVVPFLGGVQGHVHTDVNYLATELAARLGGRAYQLHAPAFVESAEQRDLLLSMGPIKEILDIAREANLVLMGVGTVEPRRSRFVQFTALSAHDMEYIAATCGGIGEIGGFVYTRDGTPCALQYADRVVGLTLAELERIPFRIAIAATVEKRLPIYGALRGDYFQTLITDETAARGVLQLFRSDF
jgi:DNA-binding transcriptional regulator LsrR (DeoR family)